LLPVIGPLPVSSQRRDMFYSFDLGYLVLLLENICISEPVFRLVPNKRQGIRCI